MDGAPGRKTNCRDANADEQAADRQNLREIIDRSVEQGRAERSIERHTQQ